MPSTRRQVLGAGLFFLTGSSGCTALGDGTPRIRELTIELVNETASEHVFHVAVETADGMGEWASRRLASGSRSPVTWEPPDGQRPVAVHGIVDEYAIRGELIGLDRGTSEEICPRVVFAHEETAEPSILQSTDVRC